MKICRKSLLIEDNKIAQRIPTLILEHEGWNVDIANNGHEAINLISSNIYDLILLDIGLPDFDGRELAKIIRSMLNNQKLPIIGLTAHDDMKLPENHSINELLAKPFSKNLHDYLMQKYFLISEKAVIS